MKTNDQASSVMLSAAKHLAAHREILRFAQDDKRPAIITDLGW